MNLPIAFLTQFPLFFNYWFLLKTRSEIDYILINNSPFAKAAKFTFSTFEIASHSIIASKDLLLTTNSEMQEIYFLFTVAIALVSISVELLFFRNTKKIKKDNESLRMANSVIADQNSYLQDALKALEESREANTRMMQVMAHDLRSPIAAIVSLSSFMIDEHSLADEDLEVISLIHTSGVDSLKFINDMLDRESTMLEMKKEIVDLHSLLCYCISQLQYKAREKKQQIKLETTITTKIRLNREKIWRVITNLIVNAIKFSPTEGEISIALQLTDEKAVISVKDRGIGIPESLRDKVFGMSAQRKREGTAGEKSFGMGLAIAKQNIEAHGGTLSFESQDGRGSTFFIALPLA